MYGTLGRRFFSRKGEFVSLYTECIFHDPDQLLFQCRRNSGSDFIWDASILSAAGFIRRRPPPLAFFPRWDSFFVPHTACNSAECLLFWCRLQWLWQEEEAKTEIQRFCLFWFLLSNFLRFCITRMALVWPHWLWQLCLPELHGNEKESGFLHGGWFSFWRYLYFRISSMVDYTSGIRFWFHFCRFSVTWLRIISKNSKKNSDHSDMEFYRIFWRLFWYWSEIQVPCQNSVEFFYSLMPFLWCSVICFFTKSTDCIPWGAKDSYSIREFYAFSFRRFCFSASMIISFRHKRDICCM